MLPLPACDVVFPETLDEVVLTLSKHGARARLVAGGTDLLPNLKRGLAAPEVLVSLARVRGLDAIEATDEGLRIGARVTLATLARDPRVREIAPALARAADLVASPQIRNVATVAGNLCLDTRCVFVNQTAFWRDALGGCIKADGTKCHVVERGRSCVAASSADLPPVLLAHGATARVVSARPDRTIPLDALYSGDGARPIALAPDEILASITVPRTPGLRVAYRKLRPREAIDFPLLGVAAAVVVDDSESCTELRVIASCMNASPRRVPRLDEIAVGRRLDAALVDAIAERCFRHLRPLANLAADPEWRRAMVPILVRDALAELTPRRER